MKNKTKPKASDQRNKKGIKCPSLIQVFKKNNLDFHNKSLNIAEI